MAGLFRRKRSLTLTQPSFLVVAVVVCVLLAVTFLLNSTTLLLYHHHDAQQQQQQQQQQQEWVNNNNYYLPGLLESSPSVSVPTKIIDYYSADQNNERKTATKLPLSTTIIRKATSNKRPAAAAAAATTDTPTTRNTVVRTIDAGGGGAFVHIGKTAGSTLSLLLRNGCHSFLPKPCRVIPDPESIASQQIDNYYHVPDFQFLPSSTHSFYILSIRDPFDRTVSAFAYDHPLNMAALDQQQRTDTNTNTTLSPAHVTTRLVTAAAYRCFPSLETFVEYVGDNVTDFEYHLPPNRFPLRAALNGAQCRHFARAVLNSRVRKFTHLFFNYGKILSLLLPVDFNFATNGDGGSSNVTIYATRKENLWGDWTIINGILRDQTSMQIIGKDETSQGLDGSTALRVPLSSASASARNVSGLMLRVTRELSVLGRRRLCQALESEYRDYLLILRTADNLSDDDVQDSLAYSRRNCPDLDFLTDS